MAARKVLTRAESQAQTRQELLDAADDLFIRNGYQATSLAAVAAEAGRTIGAVYSNFDGKDALCLEVLRNRMTANLSALAVDLVSVSDTIDARVGALGTWWGRVAEDTELFILAAEYLTSIMRSVEQQTFTVEVIERLMDSTRVLLEESLPEGTVASAQSLDEAARAGVATLMGLALGQTTGFVNTEQSVRLLTSTVRLWAQQLASSAD